MKRAGRIARWMAFLVTALAAADLLSMVIVGRLGAGAHPTGAGAVAAAPPRHRPPRNTEAYLQPIVKRNLFHAASAETAKPPDTQPDSGTVFQTSSLAQRFQLVGTVVSTNREESVAVVQERAGAGDSNVYPLGGRLADEADIVGIEGKRIVLDVNGRKEQIEIELEGDQPGASTPLTKTAPAAVAPAPAGDLADGIRRNPDGTFTLDSRMVEGQLANLSELLTQARAVPNFEDGKTNGFRLFSIKRGSIFDQIGLRNGDVIRKVNSNELNDPAVALNVFQDLRSARDFQVTVLRNNHEETLSYQVR